MPKKYSNKSSAFTIVELLVVIVVIGILAAVTIVSYTSIAQKAIASSLQSDLVNASKLLKMDQITNMSYPATLIQANGGKGIPSSPDTTYQYSFNNSINPQTFCLTATKNDQSFNISSDSTIKSGGKNIIPINQFTGITLLSDSSYRTSSWATPMLNNTKVLSIFEPSTTYRIKAKYTLEINSALPVYQKLVGFNLYSASTGSFMIGTTATMTNINDVFDVDATFTTPASLGDKQLLFYSNRYTDGVTVELGRVLVEYLKIEKGSSSTCWTPAT